MRLIKPYHRIEYITPEPLKRIEQAGRTCYKSEDKITPASAEKFVEMVIKRGHESVIEHANMTVRFICDRGVTHEIVRHRLCAYSQESTRYCNYRGGVAFIIPPWISINPGEHSFYDPTFQSEPPNTEGEFWFNAMIQAEGNYIKLIEKGWTPQQARSVLPNSLKNRNSMYCKSQGMETYFQASLQQGCPSTDARNYDSSTSGSKNKNSYNL